MPDDVIPDYARPYHTGDVAHTPWLPGQVGWLSEGNYWYPDFGGVPPTQVFTEYPAQPSGGPGSSGGGIGPGPGVGSSGYSALSQQNVGGGYNPGPDLIAQQNEAMRNALSYGMQEPQYDRSGPSGGGGFDFSGGGDDGGGFDPGLMDYGSGAGSMYDYGGSGTIIGYDDYFQPVYGSGGGGGQSQPTSQQPNFSDLYFERAGGNPFNIPRMAETWNGLNPSDWFTAVSQPYSSGGGFNPAANSYGSGAGSMYDYGGGGGGQIIIGYDDYFQPVYGPGGGGGGGGGGAAAPFQDYGYNPFTQFNQSQYMPAPVTSSSVAETIPTGGYNTQQSLNYPPFGGGGGQTIIGYDDYFQPVYGPSGGGSSPMPDIGPNAFTDPGGGYPTPYPYAQDIWGLSKDLQNINIAAGSSSGGGGYDEDAMRNIAAGGGFNFPTAGAFSPSPDFSTASNGAIYAPGPSYPDYGGAYDALRNLGFQRLETLTPQDISYQPMGG